MMSCPLNTRRFVLLLIYEGIARFLSVEFAALVNVERLMPKSFDASVKP